MDLNSPKRVSPLSTLNYLERYHHSILLNGIITQFF